MLEPLEHTTDCSFVLNDERSAGNKSSAGLVGQADFFPPTFLLLSSYFPFKVTMLRLCMARLLTDIQNTSHERNREASMEIKIFNSGIKLNVLGNVRNGMKYYRV